MVGINVYRLWKIGDTIIYQHPASGVVISVTTPEDLSRPIELEASRMWPGMGTDGPANTQRPIINSIRESIMPPERTGNPDIDHMHLVSAMRKCLYAHQVGV